MTRKYKTLKGFFRANGLDVLDLYDYLYKQVYNNNTHKLIHFQLSEEADNEARSLFAEGIVSRNVKKYARYIATVSKPCGIFRGVRIVRCKNGSFYGQYSGFQDCESETRYVQHLIRKYH